jgi:peptidyl-prolyl cis-trans isomerase B (cyclophilin B)
MLASLLCVMVAAEPSIAAERLFSPPLGPVEIRVTDLSDDAARQVVLMAADGTLITESGPLDVGVINLLEVMPQIAELKQAAYLQYVVADQPIGSPLVIQPLINRPLVRTTEALRPDGTTKYTRIIGWGDELLEPGNEAHQKLKEGWTKGDPTPLSGFRVYAEEDAVLETSMGEIRVALRPDEAPNTVWNFMELVRNGFYDGTTFHRVVPVDRQGRPFVIQGGDPTGTGDGGPGWDLPLEPSRLRHDFGVISMARADAPDSAGSQFFFALSREGTARLDGQYCAFGCAVTGAEAIARIAAAPIADPEKGRPADPAVVVRARLEAAPARVVGKGRADACVTAPVIEEAKEAEDDSR